MSVEGTQQGAYEARRRRWFTGGALAAALVTLGAVAAVVAVDGGHAPKSPAQATSGPPHTLVAGAAKPAAGAPENLTGDAPPAPKEPVFSAIEEEKLGIAMPPDDEVDHLARAGMLEASGDKAGAVEELRMQLGRTPDDVATMWRIVRVADRELGDRALEEIRKSSKTDAEAPREIARRRLDDADPKGALPFALEACRREPTSWESWQLKGRALLNDHQLGGAIAAFRKATEQLGAPSFPFNNLGYALLLAGRPTEALLALDTAVDRGPVNHLMMNNLGLAYERLGRLDEAEVAFLGALELRGDYVKAQVNLQRVGEAKELLAKVREEENAKEATETTAATTTETPATPEHVEPGPLHGG